MKKFIRGSIGVLAAAAFFIGVLLWISSKPSVTTGKMSRCPAVANFERVASSDLPEAYGEYPFDKFCGVHFEKGYISIRADGNMITATLVGTTREGLVLKAVRKKNIPITRTLTDTFFRDGLIHFESEMASLLPAVVIIIMVGIFIFTYWIGDLILKE